MNATTRPQRNPAAELAGHLLVATALAEKTARAVEPERRAEVEELLTRLEEAVELTYRLVPAARDGARREAATTRQAVGV
jgi:hypothetical protein